ncbi:MAG: hypothetical protein DRH11_05555 [Deltaproteobacteria bacterium]|nr:MAG: hypothetical protein DRH11_05555 [Deltaproteobacteria bacterium]
MQKNKGILPKKKLPGDAVLRPLQNIRFCSRSRKTKISATGILEVFRGLKFESDEEIGQKTAFCKGLILWT